MPTSTVDKLRERRQLYGAPHIDAGVFEDELKPRLRPQRSPHIWGLEERIFLCDAFPWLGTVTGGLRFVAQTVEVLPWFVLEGIHLRG